MDDFDTMAQAAVLALQAVEAELGASELRSSIPDENIEIPKKRKSPTKATSEKTPQTKKYKRSLINDDWLELPELQQWCVKHPFEPGNAICKVCEHTFQSPNRRTLVKHGESRKHAKAILMQKSRSRLKGKKKPNIVQMTRIQSFSAAHNLHCPDLSDEENKAVFGNCFHPYEHGHNYKAEVKLQGPVDCQTGMLCNITDLKVWMEEAIVKPLDCKNLDMDVDWFKVNPSTTSNIALYVWHAMQAAMTDPSILHAVKIIETEDHFAVYKGECEDLFEVGEHEGSEMIADIIEGDSLDDTELSQDDAQEATDMTEMTQEIVTSEDQLVTGVTQEIVTSDGQYIPGMNQEVVTTDGQHLSHIVVSDNHHVTISQEIVQNDGQHEMNQEVIQDVEPHEIVVQEIVQDGQIIQHIVQHVAAINQQV